MIIFPYTGRESLCTILYSRSNLSLTCGRALVAFKGTRLRYQAMELYYSREDIPSSKSTQTGPISKSNNTDCKFKQSCQSSIRFHSHNYITPVNIMLERAGATTMGKHQDWSSAHLPADMLFLGYAISALVGAALAWMSQTATLRPNSASELVTASSW